MITHVVPKPNVGLLITIAIPIARTTQAGRREHLLADERRLAGDRREILGSFARSAPEREHGEHEAAADPEDGDGRRGPA